jgi:hypothetical protein
MAPKKSLLDDMRNNPRGDWTIDDVKRLCRNEGLTILPPSNGSHYKVESPDSEFILTIPYKRPIKPIYIRTLVGFINAHRRRSKKVKGKEK